MNDNYESIVLCQLLAHLQLNYNIPLESTSSPKQTAKFITIMLKEKCLLIVESIQSEMKSEPI